MRQAKLKNNEGNWQKISREKEKEGPDAKDARQEHAARQRTTAADHYAQISNKMPRLFEGTGGSKRRPGLGSGGSSGSGSSNAAASAGLGLGLALETANNGNSNSQRRRTAMDLLIDTDSSSSEDERGSGGRVAADSSSFDFGASDPAKEKENSGNSGGSSKKKRQITVSDKAKAKTNTAASKTSKKPAAKKRSTAGSSSKKQTQQQAAGGTEKQKAAIARKDTSNKPKPKPKPKAKPKAKTISASTSSRATKSTTRKRSPTRVRFDDGTAENNDSSSAQVANDERGNMVSPQTSTGSSTTTSTTIIPTIPIPPRAVAVDTRTVQSFGGDAAGAAFLRHTLAFLKSCARRGMLPPVLAVTAAAGGRGGGEGGGVGTTSKKRATAAIGTRAVHLPTDTLTGREYEVGGDDSSSSSSSLSEAAQEEQIYWRDLLLEAAVPVRCASASAAQPLTALDGGVGGGDGGVPKALLAHDSWKYFAELVASVDGQIQRDNGAALTTATTTAAATHHRRRPRALTIFTNDVALFSDTAVDSHKRALGRFWDTIRGSFRNGSVGSVQIAIYETGAAALVTGKSGRRQETRQTKESSASPLEGDSVDDGSDEDTATDEALAHRLRVKQCISLLQREIQDLQEKDRRKSASPISAELRIIESPIRFQALLRDWIRAVVSTASGARGSKISFDLPETLDGSQCSCSLDLVPSLLPHRVDSIEAAKLMMDLKALSIAELEVVQVVPISSVDGSLLYGVPMSATAAMDSDLFRYKEMKVLTRQLFRYMATKDVALALRCVGTKSGDKENESALDANLDSTNASANTSIEEGQIFLLMAEHPTEPTGQSLSSTSSSGSGAAPARGVLYRYATSDHLVHDLVTVDDCDSEDEETNEQYFEYVEQSLQMVDSAMLNPILVSSKAIPKKKKDPLSLDDILSADMSDADSDTESPMNESSLETNGDAMMTENSLKSDQEDFGSFFDDDDDEDLRFFDNDFEYQ